VITARDNDNKLMLWVGRQRGRGGPLNRGWGVAGVNSWMGYWDRTGEAEWPEARKTAGSWVSPPGWVAAEKY